MINTMPTPKTNKIQVHLLFEPDFLYEIETFRHQNRLPTRVETIMELLRLGLDSAKKPRAAKKSA